MNHPTDPADDAIGVSNDIEAANVIEESPEIPLPVATRYRRAIIVSVIVHVVGLTALLFWYLPSKSESATQPTAAASPADRAEPRSLPADIPKPVQNPQVPAEQIQASIESQIEKYDRLPDERKLSELEKNLKRLEAISSEESVQQVTSTIAGTLGLDQEAYVAKEHQVEGAFDIKTAQLSDVTRGKDAKGRWQYESVLVDAEGRSTTMPMSAADGETAYNAFQQIKKFPMAEGIYRSVVMPMMQKMIEANELVEKAAVEAERINQDQGASSETSTLDSGSASVKGVRNE